LDARKPVVRATGFFRIVSWPLVIALS
jgi:hypothetical protein